MNRSNSTVRSRNDRNADEIIAEDRLQNSAPAMTTDGTHAVPGMHVAESSDVDDELEDDLNSGSENQRATDISSNEKHGLMVFETSM